MSISRRKAVERYKRKQLKQTLNWIVYPTAIAGALLFGKTPKKRRKKKASLLSLFKS
jgi:hypothetical protein